MDTKKVLILTVLLAVLAALYFVSGQQAAKKARKEEVALAAEFNTAEAVTVTVKAPGKDDVILKRQGEAWQVARAGAAYPADAAAVTSLLDQVGGMRSATAVSRNPKNHESFEVSDGKAVHVKIEGAEQKVLAHLLLGKNGPDIFSTYVRAMDAETVYLVPGVFRNMADKELKDWRDKTIFRFNGDRIVLYTVSGDKNLQVRKDPRGGWTVACDGRVHEVKPSEAETALQSFATLAAVDFDNTTLAEAQLDDPLQTVTAVLDNGTKQVLLVGKDKNVYQRFVTARGRGEVFVAEKATIETLAPACEKLLGESEAGKDNATGNATLLPKR